MTSITINPGDYKTFADLQKTIDTNDEIHFAAGTFDIGSNTILVRGPKKFSGVGQLVQPCTLIKGTSGYLMANIIPTIANPSSKIGAGIFSILGNGTVEITGINFEHTPEPSPAPLPDGNFTHGSGTIAYFVDNCRRSSLVVTDCVIDTSATGAINIDSINKADPLGPPITHDFTIRRCKIPGRYPASPHPLADPNLGGGNWLSVKLGPMPSANAAPVDMRDSYFEVSDCDLDPAAFAGIAVWLCESNSETEFVISNNKIAQSPKAGALDYGVFLGFPISTNTPNGTAVIQDNRIEVGHYHLDGGKYWSFGILVNVSNTQPDKKIRTVIVGNTVSLSHPPPDQPDITYAGGISYWDRASDGSQNVTALIDENTINGGITAPPRWGIALRGPAHDFVVNDNHLESLNSGVAQIYIEKDAHDGILSGNVLGQLKSIVSAGSAIPQEAVIFCDGDNNRFFDNDFTPSLAPGWDPPHTGPGYFKLGSDSDYNILVDPDMSADQFQDKGTNNHMLQP